MISVKYRLKYQLITLFITLLIFLSCTASNTIIEGNTMGTTYSISIPEFKNNKVTFKNQIDSLLTIVNNMFSTYIDSSEISIINTQTSKNINVSNEFSYVLNKALEYSQISNGNYDVTIGPLIDLWGFNKSDKYTIPNKENIDNTLKNIGYEKIILIDNVLIDKRNLKFDFNSIAKGYGVDVVSEYISDRGYINYLVEIGGEIRSSSDESKEWIVGIQNPISNSIIKKIKLKNHSLATSGTYNNYFKYEGKLYSHIINPKTGYPYIHKTVSATIIANKCIDADAYATLAMTMNPEDVLDIVNKEDQVDCYILQITDDNKIIEFISDSFKDFIF